jgi:hypothetical protein
MAENTFIIHTDTPEQENALKAFVKTLKVKFEVTNKPYNPEFVAKIRQSEKEIEEGKTVTVNKEDLKQLLGL